MLVSVTGLHWLEAPKAFGWETIDAFTWAGTKCDADSWESNT